MQDTKRITEQLNTRGIVAFQADDSPEQQAVKTASRELAEATGFLYAVTKSGVCIILDQDRHEIKLES